MPRDARTLVLEHFRWIDGHADVWRIFRDPTALAAVVAGLAAPFAGLGVTAVCGVESRGFLLGAATAIQLGVGFVPVRKPGGLFPGEKLTHRAAPDYRGLRHELRLQRAALTPADRVLLVDDWIETGSQATAVRSLVEAGGSNWAGSSVIVDQTDEAHRRALNVHGLVTMADLPAWEAAPATI
ncbi:Phosphoribosyltransferase [Kitasatospora sp. MMS16-BH015]|uniref:phosphoribosyltransferase n=1 Tax=Kitasatospora sp. MMS16-BH015 TaxID=2018025 RepID=UPI000CA1946D|nr:phosphoribosyltransferase [Kitasatospora sp. MMS16-BH015]AUG80830.1 Phosphoribosyltransferase [Kitasatospora sp. MMS16-BH015]